MDHRYFPDLLDGDQEVRDGINVLLTPGHTVGGQSIVVNTKKGKAVITGFCCNDQNFPASGPCVPPGVHLNLMDAYDSVRKVKDVADIILPLHDLSLGRHKNIPD